MKKRGKGIQIYFTNRWLYTLIIVLILAAVGVGVYALTPGVIPNPGHNISEVSIPSGCQNGQFLQYDSTKGTLVCASGNSITKNTTKIYSIMGYCSGAGTLTTANKCYPTTRGTCTVGNYNIVCCPYYTCSGGSQTICGVGNFPAQCDNTLLGYLVN